MNNEKLTIGLEGLNNLLFELTSEILKTETEIDKTVELLKVLSPVEKAIKKAILKSTQKSKSIPKQSTLNQSRS